MAYPEAKEILILADSGGSNGCRPRMWKQQLQEHFSDHYGLTVTVSHYPTGCSQWNPIEHRLFSQISLNWAGVPLRSFETVLSYIRGTITQTGLTVRARLLEGEYTKGQKVSISKCSNSTLRSPRSVLDGTTRSDLVPGFLLRAIWSRKLFFNRP